MKKINPDDYRVPPGKKVDLDKWPTKGKPVYSSKQEYAKLLGEEEAVSLLRQTLEEEKETDEKLTELASSINLEAAGSEESDEEELEGNNGRRNTRAARA